MKLTYVNGKIEGIIYRYVNQTEGPEKGWSYVGNTSNEKERQQSWRNRSNKRYGGDKITNARERFGIDAFEYEVLEKVYADTEEEIRMLMNEREAYYIEKYDSSGHGYNTSMGGTGMKGVQFSLEHKDKISKNHRKTQSTETREKISAATKGHVVSAETKTKISNGNQGKKRTQEQNMAQSERMKGSIPVAATEAAKAWVVSNGGGYWSNHPISAEAKKNMKAAQEKRATKVRATYLDGHTQDYASESEAGRAFGLKAGSINYRIKAGTPSKDGVIFSHITKNL